MQVEFVPNLSDPLEGSGVVISGLIAKIAAVKTLFEGAVLIRGP